MKYATVGSISHGTLRNEDLLDTFASELEYHVQRNKPELKGRLRDLGQLIRLARKAIANEALTEADQSKTDDIDSPELVNDLIDAIETFSPPYCYFGTHEGDGSDFGFWPSMDAIDELPKVSDPNEVENMGEDCVYVNDHGNVTVYGADGSVLIDFV